MRVAGGEHQRLEPRQQIKGDLPKEQLGPGGMKAPRGELLQPQAALVCRDPVFHIGLLEMPPLQFGDRGGRGVGDEDMVRPIQLPFLGLSQLPLDYIPIGLGPPRGAIAQLGDLT